ncbi:MAG: hypothetical protein NC541_11875 [bacterium]|nr:hypothetical protein [bacterium]
MNIIKHENGKPFMENNSGFRWTPYCKDGKWGLGSFCVGGAQIGRESDCFVAEETVGQKFFCYDWKELKNSAETGHLQFSGYDGKARMTVDVIMKQDVPAVIFDVAIDPELPINHRIYAKAPFDTAQMDFVKFPFEDTILSERPKYMRQKTSFANAPAVLACQNLGAGKGYLSVGYTLDSDFDRGELEFDPSDKDTPLRIYHTKDWIVRSVDMQLSWKFQVLREIDFDKELLKGIQHFKFVVSGGETQYDCVKGYIDTCGYDKQADFRYCADDICDDIFDSFKRAKNYIKGKGYQSLLRSDNGKMDNMIARGGYGKLIIAGANAGIALELYRHYLNHPEELWAKEYACEMADFLCAYQLPNGAILPYDSDTGAVDKTNPAGTVQDYMGGYVLMMMSHSAGARAMLELSGLAEKHEPEKAGRWFEAGAKGVYFIAGLISEEGILGRNYNFKGEYDQVCPAVNDSLLALEYLYQKNGDEKINDARNRLETYVWNRFMLRNCWINDSFDGGNWDANDSAIDNNDSMNMATFISYCALVHSRTKEQRYIDMAKHVMAYQWLISVPVQLKGFTHFTRGLQKEQDFYTNFDIPFKAQDIATGYPYLAKESGDPFFMEWYGILLQTEMSMQEKEQPFRMIHLGLECDREKKCPTDVLGEGKQLFMVASDIFVNSVRHPKSYQYVGGKGWGRGRDYYLPFSPEDVKDLPYVLSSTSMLREMEYDAAYDRMRYCIYDRECNEATLEIKWNTDRDIGQAAVFVCDKKYPAKDLYDPETDVLTIQVTGDGSPSKLIFISFHGSP